MLLLLHSSNIGQWCNTEHNTVRVPLVLLLVEDELWGVYCTRGGLPMGGVPEGFGLMLDAFRSKPANSQISHEFVHQHAIRRR